MGIIMTMVIYPHSKEVLNKISETFQAGTLDDKETLSTIEDIYQKYRVLIDPHTAVGVHASRKHNDNSHLNCILATASPVKFSETVEEAINKNLNLLEGYDSLFESSEKYVELSNNVDEVKNQISTKNS